MHTGPPAPRVHTGPPAPRVHTVPHAPKSAAVDAGAGGVVGGASCRHHRSRLHTPSFYNADLSSTSMTPSIYYIYPAGAGNDDVDDNDNVHPFEPLQDFVVEHAKAWNLNTRQVSTGTIQAFIEEVMEPVTAVNRTAKGFKYATTLSRQQTPFLPRICSRTLMDCFPPAPL